MRQRVLIVGFYGHSNIGDSAFQPAFAEIIDASLTFTDYVPAYVNDYDALIFGGGSFADSPIPSLVSPEQVTIPIGFIGVGLHGVIDPTVRRWLDRARIVVVRNAHPEYRIQAPDLLFAREWEIPRVKSPAGILVLGNEYAIPDRDDPQWRAAAWQWFVTEIAMILDGKDVTFFPMCSGSRWRNDDRLFPPPIISQMRDREGVRVLDGGSEADLITEICGASMIITLRLHGAVLAAICDRPFVGVSFHDKTTAFFADNDLPNVVDFYGFNHRQLAAVQQPSDGILPALRQTGHASWQALRGLIGARLEL